VPWVAQGDGPIPVLAAVIERSGQWLVCQRPEGKRHAGLWEFPGGKLEPGESLEDAARRELQEELGVEVESVGPILFRTVDPGSIYEIVFVATVIRGTAVALEHEAISWMSALDMCGNPLAPSDLEFLEQYLLVE
jgi:8-oxo-dGTP diphosphatase